MTETAETPHAGRKGRDLRDSWPVVAQLLGVAFIATGFGVLSVWAGLAVGGAGLIGIGTVAEVTR